jgi:hypothetical protein
MKFLLLLLLFPGCASTRFYHNGQLVLDTQANIAGFRVTADGEMTATLMDHSTATIAGGAAFAKGAGGIGTAAIGIGSAIAGSGLTKLAK